MMPHLPHETRPGRQTMLNVAPVTLLPGEDLVLSLDDIPETQRDGNVRKISSPLKHNA